MFDFDAVPLKRKILACVIIALPVAYYLHSEHKFNQWGILESVLFFCVYAVAFLFIIATVAGIISLLFLIIYSFVLFIGRLLLGVKPESGFDGISGIAYISIGISIIIMYYLAFGGKIPKFG
jgi:hypothetical protein